MYYRKQQSVAKDLDNPEECSSPGLQNRHRSPANVLNIGYGSPTLSNSSKYKKNDNDINMNVAMTNNPMNDEENGMEMINIQVTPSTPSSPGSSQQALPIFEYQTTRFNSCWRCIKRRPRVCGGCAVFVMCVLPLLVTTGMLAAMVSIAKNGMKSTPFVPSWEDFVVYSHTAVVATDDARCSNIGRDMLTQGGSAIDAAIAAALCLGVVSPGSSGIGGGCFILTHDGATRENEFVDSREVAPSGATPDMFKGRPISAQDGGLAIAVFSELKGLHYAWTKHGKLPWKTLFQPSAELAKNWVVSKETAALLQQVRTQLHSGLYPGLSALYLKDDGSIKTVGDTVQQPLLSATLSKIGEVGPSYIYSTMAAVLSAEIRAAGGIVTVEDLQKYTPNVLPPLTTSFMGHTYVGASGSSSGGVAVAAILEFLGSYPEPLASQGVVYYHRLIEAFNHVFAMRLSLADPSFVNTTGVIRALLSPTYMAALRAQTSDALSSPLDGYGGRYNLTYAEQFNGISPTDHGTTHISVLDQWGSAVALTSTVNTYFGSKVISPSTGMLFNNQMDDFSIPGKANFFGLAPSALNYPQAGKRPLSSMSPSFVLLPCEGGGKARLRLVGGGSGGPKIITATAQMILNVVGRGMDLLAAIKAEKFHSQLLPPVVYAEDHTLVTSDLLSIRTPTDVLTALRKRGHNISAEGVIGITQFISVDSESGLITAVSDPRKDGRPAAM
jgi:gamma-glutamyltranspeptidase/glutathione hydrolase/leukotriene-C4 hydrolase